MLNILARLISRTMVQQLRWFDSENQLKILFLNFSLVAVSFQKKRLSDYYTKILASFTSGGYVD